ncbi:hypothetical protein ACFX16_026915 [Malus domestica]
MAVAVKSTEELTKQKKPLTRQRRVVVTGTSVFPAIEVMETLDKAKCMVLIGSRMGGMKGWMVPNYSTSTACATSTFCTLNSANHIIKAKAVSIPTSSFCTFKYIIITDIQFSLKAYAGPYALWWFRFSDDTSWIGRLCGMQSTVTKKQ